MGSKEMLRRMVSISGAAAFSFLIAGCTAGATQAAPTPTSIEIGKASTIEDVRDAFIEAGGVCNWEQTDVVKAATASGECSSHTVIMLFSDRSERETVVSNLQQFKLESGLTLLVGENWVINSPEAEEMQSQLGGEWVEE